MAFHFSLHTVLRLRQSLERQQELLLLEANQQLHALQLKFDGVNAQLAQSAIQEGLQLASTLSAAELQFRELCRSVLREQREALGKSLAAAQVIRDARLADFRQARQRREVLETLRQTQAAAYHQNQGRQSQRQLDDMLLLRRAYLRRG